MNFVFLNTSHQNSIMVKKTFATLNGEVHSLQTQTPELKAKLETAVAKLEEWKKGKGLPGSR